jgi:SAM-dependent methyltransferase
VSFALAAAGYRVTALEKSPSMLAEFRRRWAAAAPEVASRVEIVEGDMTRFSLGKRYSLVLIPASFGHAMTTEKQISLLESVRRHLKADGLFVLDLYPAAVIPERSSFTEPGVMTPDGRTVSRSGVIRCDMTDQIMKAEIVYSVSGDSEVGTPVTQEIRVESYAAMIFNREADLLIRTARLRVEEEFGGFDGRPYDSDCSRRILFLRK